MKPFLTALACTALVTAQISPAFATDRIVNLERNPETLQISQTGDLEMTCHQISHEVSAMENIIFDTQEIQDNSKITGTGINVGKAVGSYLVGSLIGGLGIIAAGYIVSEAANGSAKSAEALQDIAFQRRSFMAGIYNAKGCVGPLELAAIEPAAGAVEEKEAFGPPDKRTRKAEYKFNN